MGNEHCRQRNGQGQRPQVEKLGKFKTMRECWCCLSKVTKLTKVYYKELAHVNIVSGKSQDLRGESAS